MANDNETQADILAEMSGNEFDDPHLDADGIIGARILARGWAARLEAALKREADSIHRAMVLIAGIEMESSEDPPRLWTALEDAYDALCDALGTDGDTTADEEEAKATGRHFVVKPSGNAAALREALIKVKEWMEHRIATRGFEFSATFPTMLEDVVLPALSAPARNCDNYSHDEALHVWAAEKEGPNNGCFDEWLYHNATEGGAK